MAEIDLFHYRKGNSLLHRLNPGIKLFVFFILSILTFRSGIYSLIMISSLVAMLFLSVYIKSASPFSFIKTLSGFLFFLILVTSGRWLAEGNIEGLYSGLVYSWKLLILMLNSHILTTTTDTSEIHGAVYKMLKPVPFVPAGRTATMVSLTILFIPLIFDQYLECRDAFDSRLGSSSRNLVRKIFSIAYPLMQNTVFRAEEVAFAMESRCYNDNPTVPEMKIKKPDVVSLFVMCVFSTLVICMNSIL